MLELKKLIFFLKRKVLRLIELFGHRYPYISIFDYVLRFPDKAKIISLNMEESVYTEAINYSPEVVPQKSYMPIVKHSFNLFDWLAVIEDAKCYAYSDLIITSDNQALYEIKDYKSISQYGDYRDGWVFRDTEKYCKIHRHKTILIEEAFVLDGMYSWNWYHFITQILPKVKYLPMIPKEIPILVGPHAEGDNNFHTILSMFLAQYAPQRKVIYMQNNRVYQARKLYVVSSQGLLIPNLKDSVKGGLRAEWCLYKQSTINFVRNILLREIEQKDNYPQKIYISRKNASERRRFNEEEISSLMQQRGFVIVAPEEYSVYEQIALFYNARCIVACSGAALTNVLCCRQGCKLIILNNYKQSAGVFNTIATLVGVESISVNGCDKEMEGDHVQDPFVIAPNKLTDAMVRMGMLEG